MEKILYFVRRGQPTPADKSAAEKLSQDKPARVLFRNSSAQGTLTDRAEDCDAVAVNDPALVPKAYAGGVVIVVSGEGESLSFKASGAPPVKEVSSAKNALGLPEGAPKNRSELREALDAEGVDYHKNAPTEKLVDLLTSAVLNKGGESGG